MLIAMSLWLMTATTATMRVLILMGLIVLGIEGLPAQEPVPAAPPLAGEVAEALEEPEAPVGGEDSPIAPEEGPALPEPRLAELRHLVGGLASESFAVREGAQAALARYAEEHPDAVKRGLAEVYMSSQDPEQRYRLAEVIYDAVVEEMAHSGFLGIMMHERPLLVQGKQSASILVREVGKGSAADRAGLRPGDHILQVDDLRFMPNNRPVPGGAGLLASSTYSPNMTRFKSYIEQQKKGAEVNLKVIRSAGGAEDVMDVKVKLGKRPRDLMEPAERLEEEQFFEKWLKENARQDPPAETPVPE